MARILILCLTVLLMAADPVSAGLLRNEPTRVTAELTVPDRPDDLESGIFLVSAAHRFEGTVTGPVFLLDSSPEARLNAVVVRVYDTRQPETIALERPLLEVPNGSVVPDEGATFMWSFAQAEARSESPYGLSFFFDLLGNLPDMGVLVPEPDPDPEPTWVAEARHEPWHFQREGSTRGFFVPVEGGFSVQRGNGTSEHFEGDHWLVTLRNGTEASLQGRAIAVPTGPDQDLAFERAAASVFSDRFSAAGAQAFFDAASKALTSFDPPTGIPDEGFDCAARPEVCQGQGVPPGGPPGGQERAWPDAQGPSVPATETGDMSANHREDDPNGSHVYGIRTDGSHTDGSHTDGNHTDGNHTDGNQTSGNQTHGPDGPQSEGPHEGGGPGDDAAEQLAVLEDMGGFLNGALLGNLSGSIEVGGGDLGDPGFSVLRFTEMRATGFAPDTVTFAGDSPFALIAGGVVHDANVWRLGFLVVPVLAVILYVLAAGAWFGARVWKYREISEEQSAKVHLPARIGQWVVLVISLVLFDLEVRFLLGSSFLTSIGWASSPGAAVAAGAFPSLVAVAASAVWLMFLVEVALWASAVGAFAVPVGIIVRSGLRMGGLDKRADGIARGLGALAAWFFGASMILPVLDVVLGSLLGASV